MTRRRAHDGLRDRWVPAVYSATGVSAPCKLLLIAMGNYWMKARGYVSVPRGELAEFLGISETRVSHLIMEAKRAKLLDQVSGSGHRGRTAEYVAVLPVRKVVDPRQAFPAKACGTATTSPDNLSDRERLSIDDNPLRARVTSARRERDVREREVGVLPDHGVTEERSDEEVPHEFALVAVSPRRLLTATSAVW